MFDEGAGQYAHESGEYHQGGLKTVNAFLQRAIELFPFRVVLMGDDEGLDTVLPRPFQAIGIAAIADNGANLRRQVTAFYGFDNSLQIAALA